MVKTERCPWPGEDVLYRRYHDLEWGVPCRHPRELFELLVLEGFQAGLSWLTILRKRRHFRAAFDDFDPERLARMTDADVARALANPMIVRHRGKIESVRSNARVFLHLEEHGGAAEFLWSFVGGAPLINRWESMREVPAMTEASARLSSALRKLGFGFVGPTICYAFMQSAGMVNDHLHTCFRHAQCQSSGTRRCVVD
jgi:DNA-3-methyladenine glycosylase I